MLILKNVTKKYFSGESEILAVNNVSFSLEDGCFLSIVGKSGSGKSTLLNLIGGLDDVTCGHIELNGTDITNMKEAGLTNFRRKNIGFVFQFFNLIPELDAHDNILLASQLSGTPFDKAYYEKLVDILEIGDRTDHIPDRLSGGEKQRVAIARALISKPGLLLLDEPTGNLDGDSSSAVVDMIKSIGEELGQTIIMVTHDLESAEKSDRIITLRSGSIVLDRTAR